MPKGFFTGLSPKREFTGREATTPSTARRFTASPPKREVTGREPTTPSTLRMQMSLVTPSSARQASPTVAPAPPAAMDVIHDVDEDDDVDDVDIPHEGSADTDASFAVIIGKTFEAMSLPDGSQQIVETTRYKRLRDGYIYSESKVRSLDDDRSLVSGASNGGTTNDAHRDDVVDVHDAIDDGDDIKARDEMMADARLLQESSRLSQQRIQPPPPTAKNTSPFGSPIKGGKLSSSHPDVLSTFSTSSGSSSASSDWASNFQTSVVTEDHAFGRNDGGGLFVEEFLYDNDPVGLRQWKEQPRPISPKDRQVNTAAGGGGWCAFGGSSSFDNTPSSLQLGRPRNWWSFTPRAFAAPPGRAKSMFRGEDDRNDGGGSVSGFPLGFALGEKDSEDGDNDEEGGHHSYNKRKYTRRCKLKTLAISLVVVIGAVVLAVALLVPPRENLTEPSPPQCVNLDIVVSTSNQTDDVNAWSLNRIGEDGKADTIDSSESIPEKSGDSYVYKSCVEPGLYTFDISDSSGNGLGSDGEGGYYITADGITLGISSFFFHDEKMTFELPFYAENANDDHEDTACTDDFFLAVHTDGNPGETTWNVIDNDTGDEVLAGGPYSLPLAVYTQRACLPNGSYTFNMLDDGGDGVCCDNGKGFFLLSKDGKTIMNSNGEFGAESSIVFVLGDEDV